MWKYELLGIALTFLRLFLILVFNVAAFLISGFLIYLVAKFISL